jgi:heparan-alpha-glucosaminide N-acetyltransferase
MSTAADHALEPSIPVRTQPARIRSIDIFRGLTMLVMVFVNDASSVTGLPWWTYHMSPSKSGMTYVDVVFPAFLFIVGMSIPLAIRKRLEQGESMTSLWFHIATRSLSLVVMGLILANAGKADPRLAGMPEGLWPGLALIGAILFWLAYPRTGGRQTLYRASKYTGLVLLIVMLAIFRRTTPSGQVMWLDFGYWEILGLIARVYLAVCILYVPLRNKVWAPVALFGGLTAFSIAARLGMPSPAHILPHWLWPFDSGELPSIAMAGIVASLILVDSDLAKTFRQKALFALGFAALLFAGGWALTPLGISKNAATPTWCLYSAGISMVLVLAIYWLADVRRWYRWAAFVKPAGSNTLLTYLLPDLVYFSGAGSWIAVRFAAGWPGVARSMVFTAFILGVSFLLTRLRVRMQL